MHCFVAQRLVIRGFWKALETSDLWLLRKEETTAYNRNLFAQKWEEAVKQWRTEQVAKTPMSSTFTDSNSNLADINHRLS